MSNDMELKKAVLDELEFEPSVNAAEIGVAVTDGVVTLTGHVASYAEKHAAEKAARRVHGVRALAEEIEVKLPFSTSRTDADLAKAAISALEWNTMVPRDKVKVKVENGWLTLEGEVPWAFQRDTVARAVRFLIGVRGVTNLVAVKPQISTQHIRERIVGAFRRSADLDSKTICVEASDSKIRLSGTVHSWTERREAERVAWKAPGVTRVDNDIKVAA